MGKSIFILLVTGSAAIAGAQANISTGFEPPNYAPGLLNGQDSWIGSTEAGSPTVNAAPSPVFSGVHSVKMNGTVGSIHSWHPFRPFSAPMGNPNTSYLTMSASIWVDSFPSGRFFGLSLSALGDPGATAIGIGLDSDGLRGAGGGVGTGANSSWNALNGNSGLLQSRITADFLQRWVHVSVAADFSTSTNNVFFTFSNLGTSGGNSTETFMRSYTLNYNISTAMLISHTRQGPNTATAYFDNVSFGANPVPGPSTFLGLGAPLLVLMRRRQGSAGSDQ
jgi:hypothetical protein